MVRVTGVTLAFKAGSIAKAVGDSTVTVDLKKNGTTVLSAPITPSWYVAGFRGYLILYREIPDAIEVIAIVHGSMNLTRLLKKRL